MIKATDLRVGDVVELVDGRGYMRIDIICGDEIREQSIGPYGRPGSVRWCDVSLVQRVGRFVERKIPKAEDESMPHCGDCVWHFDQYACVMNCSSRTIRGVKIGLMP